MPVVRTKPANPNNSLESPKAAEETKVAEETRKPPKTLLEWEALERVFKERDRRYFTTVATIIIVLAVILVFIREFLLIGVILSLGFVAYVLATVPPGKVSHKITTHGVWYAGKFYEWGGLLGFFFTEKYHHQVLNIDTKERLPGRLFLLLGEGMTSEAVRKILNSYLSFQENPPENFMEKAAEAISQRLSLD